MKLISVIFLAFCLGFATACSTAPAPIAVSNRAVPVDKMRKTNMPMPPTKEPGMMNWVTTDGVTETFGSLRGKVVILDFWATYCPPCRDEIPHLNELQTKYGADKLQIVGLNVGGDEDRPKVPAFAKQYKIVYPIAFPEDALLAFVTGDDDRIPQTAVFDRNGKLIAKMVGFDDSVKRQLDTAIETALAAN